MCVQLIHRFSPSILILPLSLSDTQDTKSHHGRGEGREKIISFGPRSKDSETDRRGRVADSSRSFEHEFFLTIGSACLSLSAPPPRQRSTLISLRSHQKELIEREERQAQVYACVR